MTGRGDPAAPLLKLTAPRLAHRSPSGDGSVPSRSHSTPQRRRRGRLDHLEWTGAGLGLQLLLAACRRPGRTQQSQRRPRPGWRLLHQRRGQPGSRRGGHLGNPLDRVLRRHPRVLPPRRDAVHGRPRAAIRVEHRRSRRLHHPPHHRRPSVATPLTLRCRPTGRPVSLRSARPRLRRPGPRHQLHRHRSPRQRRDLHLRPLGTAHFHERRRR